MWNLIDICYIKFIRFLGGYRLTPHEQGLINELRKELCPKGKSILDGQLNILNHYNHYFGNQYVPYFYLKGFKFDYIPPNLCFPYKNDNDSVPLISMKMKPKTNMNTDSIRVDIYICGGRIYEIFLDKKPKNVFATKNPRPEEIEIFDVNLLFDPMNPNPFPTNSLEDAGGLAGWLKECASKYEVKNMESALPKDLQQKIITYYDLPFPEDYLEMVNQMEQFSIGNCKVFGLSRIWTYMTPKEYIHTLAEIEWDGVICLIRNFKPGLYYINNESHLAVPIGNSLRAAIEKVLNEGTKEWQESKDVVL